MSEAMSANMNRVHSSLIPPPTTPPSAAPLICFDLGRVLIRICDNWQEACHRAGVALPASAPSPEQTAQLMRIVYDSETNRIDQHGFATAAAPLLGLAVEHVLALSDAYLIGPYAGVPELLDDLRAASIVTACLSNTNANHWRIMTDPTHAAGLPMDRLTYRFASHLVGARKPDAAIYAHVENATGLSGNNIVFFDDVEENVAAARQRGWQANLILHNGDPVSQIRGHLAQHGIFGA
jgi:putative hydrolase of the HAD superfamily